MKFLVFAGYDTPERNWKTTLVLSFPALYLCFASIGIHYFALA